MTIIFKGFVFASFADVFVVATNVRNATNEVVMSKSNVTAFPVAQFTADQQEQLEMVLISLLDSGTIEEGVAMAMNECNTLHALRSYRDEVDADVMENIINVVTGKPMVVATEFDTLANVDLSEFFTCKTPEEARNLQSWAEAFGEEVTIKPSLVVVDNTNWDDIPF